MLLKDWSASAFKLMIGSEVVEGTNCFTYLRSPINHYGLMSDEISARVQKAHLTFVNLRHLWFERDICLPTEAWFYSTTVRAVPIYECEKRSLRI